VGGFWRGAPERDAKADTVTGDGMGTVLQTRRTLPRISTWRRDLSLRARLFLLVLTSVVPLVCMGLIQEYLDYQAERDRIYLELIQTARGMAVGVERDLQARLSALEALATSPALQPGDWTAFDSQADAFLRRQSPGTLLGISTQRNFDLRLYGLRVRPKSFIIFTKLSNHQANRCPTQERKTVTV
jgi:hypothetical protein